MRYPICAKIVASCEIFLSIVLDENSFIICLCILMITVVTLASGETPVL